MLTGDPIEAIEQARGFLKKGPIGAYHEEILLGALRLAEADAALGRLDDVRLENIRETLSEILEDIASHEIKEEGEVGDGQVAKRKVVNIDARKLGKPIFCVPGLGRLDDCAALIVADALKREGYNARVSGADTEIDAGNAEAVCVCFLEEVSEARAAFTVRKLSRKVATAHLIICALGKPDQHNVGPRSLEASPPRLPNVRWERPVENNSSKYSNRFRGRQRLASDPLAGVGSAGRRLRGGSCNANLMALAQRQ